MRTDPVPIDLSDTDQAGDARSFMIDLRSIWWTAAITEAVGGCGLGSNKALLFWGGEIAYTGCLMVANYRFKRSRVKWKCRGPWPPVVGG